MNKRLSLLYAIILVAVIALPTLRWLTLRKADGALYGYTDDIPKPPVHIFAGFFDKSLQRWFDRYYDVHLGFRERLVRSFNELNFRLFREAPKLRLISTKERGLYSHMSIENLNDEIVRKTELEAKYYIEAEKLLRIQNWLKTQNKHFEVIIGSSKPYIYPEELGCRYLVDGNPDVFERTARFGKILENTGVNVIDAGPLLRRFVQQTGIDSHPVSGVHWNYYAGCIVAKRLNEDVQRSNLPTLPLLECGAPRFAEPHWVDIDGLLLLNIWSDGNLKKLSPYPEIHAVNPSAKKPSIVFIGDSFSDQIRYALQQAKIYSRMVTSGYFRTREADIDGNGGQVTHGADTDEQTVRAKLAQDIATSDIVVLQMVDYNVPRWGYGFADYFLNQLNEN